MSKIRRRIADTLVAAQHAAAMLTTFNEIDMTAVLDLRTRYGEHFRQVHEVSLGLMSFFARACTVALQDFPVVNARLDGDDIVHHAYVHLGIAVSTERGLVVPVLRHPETLSLARIEAEIERLAAAAREGKLAIQDLSGGPSPSPTVASSAPSCRRRSSIRRRAPSSGCTPSKSARSGWTSASSSGP